MLEVREIEVAYGEFLALKGVSFRVKEGELVTIIGANGAGKSTILRAVMGLERCRKGSILFQEKEITESPPHHRSRLGMSLVPEGRKSFPDLTVLENLLMGGYIEKDRREIQSRMEEAFVLFPVLKERQNQVSKTLSGGEQQMLAIARALMSKPRVILMDEVSLGLMPLYVEETFRVIKNLHRQGVTILLVEQNARKALSIADRGYVLETGEVVLSDSSGILANHPNVKKAYLGGS
ncbi:MAG: ABC transporter ATP-binding protein [Deltaproteobacteria bacterium]|nr:ABC transporter ATP-binding protein [Deltaproteobacteria bacterium]MBM4347369.1 ABC transporter ATP-binding protein [Deltaproteobacteria bacterium]